MVEYTVSEMEAGKKLHRLIRQLLPGVPLSGIHKMLRTGRVKVNGKRGKPDVEVSSGDRVNIYMSQEDYESVRKAVPKFRGVSSEIDVLYEDDDLLVVNKPVGVLTHGAPGEYKNTLANQVLAYLYRREDEVGPFTPAPANRLDRNTSGVVLFGKNAESARRLAASLKEHSVQKWYVALVQGVLRGSGEVDVPLSREQSRNRTVASQLGKRALTRYHSLASRSNTSLIRVELVTGRTHQIRSHLAHIHHALVGDVKYRSGPGGGEHAPKDTGGYFLHAGWLELPNGTRFVAPIPPAFQSTLNRLGYSAADVQALREPPWSDKE